jgi:hypothetical protein
MGTHVAVAAPQEADVTTGRIASRGGRRAMPARLGAFALLAVWAVPGPLPVPAQEPVTVTGTWVGPWWMGKYEEPVELELTETRTDVVGRVTLWGYPSPGASAAGATVRSPVTGTIEGTRVRLTWSIPEQGPFAAELTILSPATLLGIGGVGGVSTGFGLDRSRRAP